MCGERERERERKRERESEIEREIEGGREGERERDLDPFVTADLTLHTREREAGFHLHVCV